MDAEILKEPEDGSDINGKNGGDDKKKEKARQCL